MLHQEKLHEAIHWFRSSLTGYGGKSLRVRSMAGWRHRRLEDWEFARMRMVIGWLE